MNKAPIGTFGWMLVETLGVAAGLAPTVVAQGSTKRNFASLARKCAPNPKPLLMAMTAAVETVVETGHDVDDVVRLPGAGDTVARVQALPVHSADGEVLGVQLWAGERKDAPPTPRTVAAFEWDSISATTLQGPGMGSGILGVEDKIDRKRILPEIWKYFTNFDLQDDYMAFAHEVTTSDAEPAQSFAAEIELCGADDRYRRVHMTVRARNRHLTERKIVGLVHDITDGTTTSRGMTTEFARTAAELVIHDGYGVGCLDLATGLILEWIRTPEGALHTWSTQNPLFDLRSRTAFERATDTLSEGMAKHVELDVRVKFEDSSDWISTELIVTAVGRGSLPEGAKITQALVQVVPPAGNVIGLW